MNIKTATKKGRRPIAFRHVRLVFRRPQVQRCGWVALVLLAAWSLILASVGLVLDLGMLTYTRQQMQIACEAAALAGTPELMDQSPLYPAGLKRWLAAGGRIGPHPALALQQHDAARALAQVFAARNAVGGQSLKLLVDQENAGDIVVTWLEDPTRLRSAVTAWPGHGPVNSLAVRTGKTHQRGNPLTLWVGNSLGLSPADVSTSAVATIDQRVHGFRPCGHVPVPILPIVAVRSESGDNAWLEQAVAQADSNSDGFTVDLRSGSQRVGPDGIPEITLEVANPIKKSSSANAYWITFSRSAADVGRVMDGIRGGFTLPSFAEYGGQIALGSPQGSLLMQIADQGIGQQAVAATRSIIGEKRIVMLGERVGDSSCLVTGFAAGTIVHIDSQGLSHDRLTFQPTLLITATALTGRISLRNPWLGKLMVTR